MTIWQTGKKFRIEWRSTNRLWQHVQIHAAVRTGTTHLQQTEWNSNNQCLKDGVERHFF